MKSNHRCDWNVSCPVICLRHKLLGGRMTHPKLCRLEMTKIETTTAAETSESPIWKLELPIRQF
eukprot:759588-Hanusia_phi.AAC.3